MEHLFDSAMKAVRSLFAPDMFGIFILSLFLTLFSLAAFIMLSVTIAAWWFDAGDLATLGTFLLSSMVAWFLFPGIMPVIVNFFDVKIARTIEAQDYPSANPLIDPPFWPELWHDVRFSLMAITLNLLILPFFIFPPLYVGAFYVLNGFLLGKEFFVMVARRHMPLEEAKRLRALHARAVFMAGIALTFCATVPVANLFAPFWGIALMTHLYHALRKTPKSELLPPSQGAQ